MGLLARSGVVEVAIERPDGPVVDTLLGAEIKVVVISPNQLKNLRSRHVLVPGARLQALPPR